MDMMARDQEQELSGSVANPCGEWTQMTVLSQGAVVVVSKYSEGKIGFSVPHRVGFEDRR